MNRIILIIFLSLMFNFASPGTNLLEPRLKHYIEYAQVINKKENDDEILKRKVYLYCKLIELNTQINIINLRQCYANTS